MQSQLMGGLCNNAVKTDLLGLKTLPRQEEEEHEWEALQLPG